MHGSDGADSYRQREERAQRYLSRDLKGQREWYSARASRYKARSQLLAFLVIVAGAAIVLLQALSEAEWTSNATATLGFLTVLIEGWRRIARYDETWTAYRRASERLKREERLYKNGVGSYLDLQEEAAAARFIDAVEDAIAEEQQLYWRAKEKEPDQSGPKLRD